MRPMYIGACYAEPCDTNRMKGAPLEPTDTGTALGFRLVHDSAGRVVRGGCWLVDASVARVAYRGYFDPASAVYDFGFRLCVDWGK